MNVPLGGSRERNTIRRVFIAVALLATLLPATAWAGPGPGRPRGIVPPQVNGTMVGGNPLLALLGGTYTPTAADNLTWHGGQVMHTNTNYAIYWVPAGYSVAPNYESVIDGFFQNLALASGAMTNVYAAATEYSDGTGAISTTSTFGGSADDTEPYPASGCTAPAAVHDTTECLTNAQIATEVKRFADAQGWPHGPNVVFFVYTGKNVSSCFDSTHCAYAFYCAYHTQTNSGTYASAYVYANMPWPNQEVVVNGDTYSSDCDSGQHPNGSSSTGITEDLNAADEAINVTSHESNESITDAFAGWWDSTPGPYYGFENGDMCAWNFDAATGSTATGEYNQAIGTGHYYVQGEWSNAAALAGASGCVWAVTPGNLTGPTIDGTLTIGQTLTADAGVWSGLPTDYHFTWRRCDTNQANCTTIADDDTANSSDGYTLTPSDSGHRLQVDVTASNGQGTSSTVSAPSTGVAGIPIVAAAPTITGAAAVSQVLTGGAGTWSDSPTTYHYTWLRCDTLGASCVSIVTADTAAASTTYTVRTADAGKTIVLAVRAANAAGTGATSQSTHTATVIAAPTNTLAPSILGSAAVGNQLSGQAGDWSAGPTLYRFDWLRCTTTGTACALIVRRYSAATTDAYTVSPGDSGHTIVLRVAATNAAGFSVPASSAHTAGIAPASLTRPTISGTASVGLTLTGHPGSWSGAPTAYHYTWQRCTTTGTGCAKITGATAATYHVAPADSGHTIVLAVTATDAAGTSVPASSAHTAGIAPASLTRPTISGTASVGLTLTGHAGSWSGAPTAYHYTWQRCTTTGISCAKITGATSTTYHVAPADRGHTIVLSVTATDAAGTSAPATSLPTSVV